MSLSVCALLIFVSVGIAQKANPTTLDHIDYYSSGVHIQEGTETGSVHRKVFNYPGAASLRVVFGAYTLGANDWIEVYSPFDGERHRLTNAELTKWQGTSGYFNGDTLWIDLYLAPGSTGSFDVVQYFVSLGTPGGRNTICGPTDDRVASTDMRSARFDAGCTIWLASADGCACSAGHCFSGGGLTVAEFNVPPSTSGGSVQRPPISDQFPVDPTTITFSNGGIGDDWGVCKLLTNNLGQQAHVLYGHFNVVFTKPPLNDPIRITGYGTDNTPPSANQTLQTHAGLLAGNSGSRLQYTADTTGGNSGSPVIHDTTGDAVGIHTHGGCNSGGGSNSGTSFSHTPLQTAFNALCNLTPAVPVADFNPTGATTIVAGQSVTFADASTGVPTSWLWDVNGDSIVDATTPALTFQYNTPGTYNVSLTVTNALGTDTITRTAHVTVNAITPVSLPFSEDFQNGLPNNGSWVFESDVATGRIQAGSSGAASPVSGSPSLVMDSSLNSTFATNESILFVDLATTNGGILRYWFKETNDENHPEDGLFLSDGVTEIELMSHQNGPQIWTQYQIDLTAAASAGGLGLTNNMQLIFRQRDNFGTSTDGHLIDDISIIPPPIPDVGQPNSPDATFSIDGMIDQNTLEPTPGQNGPFFVSVDPGDQLVMRFDGLNSGFIWLVAGGLNRGNATFGQTGQLDLGFLGSMGLFTDVLSIIDGVNQVTLSDALFGRLAPDGTQVITFGMPGGFPPGPFAAFQTVFFPNIVLSAAIEVSYN